MTIKCAVVGQSNSILKYGFAAQLAEHEGVELVRFGRVGMSSSLLGPFFIQPGFASGLDFCLIDLAMFDHSIKDNRGGRYDFDALRRYLKYCIHRVRADGCCPILIAFCPFLFEKNGRWYRALEEISEITEVHRQVAAEEKCPIFDWPLFLKNATVLSGDRTVQSFYTEWPDRPGEVDGSHPNSEAQQWIVQLLLKYMRFHLGKAKTQHSVAETLSTFYPVFCRELNSSFGNITRTTGVMECSFVSLNEGDSLSIPAAPDELLAGYTININQTCCFVDFVGSPAVVKDMRFPAALRVGNLRYHIAPIFEASRPVQGQFSVRVGREGSATEEGIIKLAADQTVEKATLELEAVVIERQNQDLAYVTSNIVDENADIVLWALANEKFLQ